MPYGNKESYSFFKMKYQGNNSAFPFKSPMKDKTGYSEKAKNLLKAVPNEEAFNKLSEKDQKSFNKAAKKYGLPMQNKN